MRAGIEALIEKLQRGWNPDARQIYVPQQDVLDWSWWPNSEAQTLFVRGVDLDGGMVLHEVLWIDRHLEWAVAPSAFLWLYDPEESQKVRYLGG
ncbi:MAG: hypothetical protein CFE29_04550 [Bradyrhizobiaceae bacterium PARB1]|jgi:hypothetical protein|nr:MAG: hypothetical protein CFE29_04550 [Bradyrhizobiaceae bacterium PARB1]